MTTVYNFSANLALDLKPTALEISTLPPPPPSLTLGWFPASYFSIPWRGQGGVTLSRAEEGGSRDAD